MKFVILDEPFSGIEPIYKNLVKELVLSHKPAKGILVTDHDYRNILAISDYLVLIHRGHCKHVLHEEELREWGYCPIDFKIFSH